MIGSLLFFYKNYSIIKLSIFMGILLMDNKILTELKDSRKEVKSRFYKYKILNWLFSGAFGGTISFFISHDLISFIFSFVSIAGLSGYVGFFLLLLFECKNNHFITKSAKLHPVLNGDKNWKLIAQNSKIIK